MLTEPSDVRILARRPTAATRGGRPAGRAPAPAGPTLREGDLVDGRYRVEEALGEGGMGIVVAARDLEIGHRVAIKYLRPGACHREDMVARFRWEASAVRRMTSEHVVRVIDEGTLWNGAPYIVMELLEGSDLGRLLERRIAPIAIEEAVDYVLQACAAIAEAHALGIVHRDLKPENLFITTRADGTPFVKVIDFGISSGVELTIDDGSPERAPVEVQIMGSPAYMAPEQVRNFEAVDGRADIWSLGAILYELITGNMIHDEQSIGVLLAKICYLPVAEARTHRPDVPKDLDRIVLRCLERDPDRRIQDVQELARALLPFAGARSQPCVARILRGDA